MAYTTVKEWCTGIANAIREKDGTTELIARQDFPSRISAIKQGDDILINSVDLDYILDGGTSRMFIYKYIDFSRCTSAQYFMNGCKLDEKGQKITSVDTRILNLAGAKIDNFNYSFNGMTNCTELILPPEGFNARATNYMFGGFAGTKIENLEFMGDDTGSNATNDHRNMFRASKILEADLSGFTGRVTSLNMCQNMFYQCPVRKIWIPSTWKNISCNSQGYSMVNGISNPDCIIFTDAPSMPSTWSGLWYYRTATVPVTIAWGSNHNEYSEY